MKAVKNINYYKDLYMDLFLPDKEEFYTFIHFHGGGLVEGDKGDTHISSITFLNTVNLRALL